MSSNSLPLSGKLSVTDKEESELLEVKPEFMGFHKGDYPGAFPPKVEQKIRQIASSPCLHLFSGSSRIGDERIDLKNRNATKNCDVYEFIRTDERLWEFVVADPVYQLEAKHLISLLKGYARYDSVSGIVLYQRLLQDYLKARANQVLWFDTCSPRFTGFYRFKTWFYIEGSWHKIRALTWLKREGERLI